MNIRIGYAILPIFLAACGGADRPAELGPEPGDAGLPCDQLVASTAIVYDAHGVGSPVSPAPGCRYDHMLSEFPYIAGFCCPFTNP